MANKPKVGDLKIQFDPAAMAWKQVVADNVFNWQEDIERMKMRRKVEQAAREAAERQERDQAQERAAAAARIQARNALHRAQAALDAAPAQVLGQPADFIVFHDVEAAQPVVPEWGVAGDNEEEEEDFPHLDDDERPEEMPVRPARAPRPNWAGLQAQDVFDPFRKQPMLNVKEGPSGYRGMTERSTRLPRFKLEYASQEEARMRLEGTLITVQDRMVKVQKIQTVKQDGEVGSGCIAMDENGDLVYLLFAVDGMNFRSPDPGFIQIGDQAYYFRRKPARIYKQGINGENTHFTKAGRPERVPLFGSVPDHVLIRAFNDRPIILFDEDQAMARSSWRLSDRIAVFKKNGGKLHVAHRDFVLGPLEKGNKVKVENCCPWVENALNAVGIQAIPVEG